MKCKYYENWSGIPVLFVHVGFLFRVRGSIVVEALCYKPEGRGFETR
jgi:hypothetical protein